MTVTALPRPALTAALHGALPHLHAVVDAARGEEARHFIRTAGELARCLFAGPDAALLAERAPYLVPLDGARLDAWLARAWGDAWGVILHATAPRDALAEDLRRALLARLPDGRRVLFRPYDPRVLRTFAAAASPEARWLFHRRADRFVVEDAAGDALVIDRPPDASLDPARLAALDRVRRDHLAFPIEAAVSKAFRDESRRRFVRRITEEARGRAPEAEVDEGAVARDVDGLVPLLAGLGVRSERAVAAVALHLLREESGAFWSGWPAVQRALTTCPAGTAERRACALDAEESDG